MIKFLNRFFESTILFGFHEWNNIFVLSPLTRQIFRVETLFRLMNQFKRIFPILAVYVLFGSKAAFSQCEIQSKIATDGSLYYFVDEVNFYASKSKQLSGGVVTDKEYYYIHMLPNPFPPRPQGNKLKDSLEVTLANNKTYKLGFYYSAYENNDSTFELLYLINKADFNDFLEYDVLRIVINMGGEEGRRTYNLKLHRHALAEELKCLLEDGKKKEKKD